MVRVSAGANAESTHRIQIKLQLTGKSHLVFEFYCIMYCVSIAGEILKVPM